MSLLLKEIQKISSEAATVLGDAKLTESEIRSLSREDLRDLFPKAQQFKLRKKVFEIIHRTKPINVVLQEMKAFVPDDYIRASVTENGVFAEYLQILKELKTQMNNVQDFLDAHIDLLENISKSQMEPDPKRASFTKSPTFTQNHDPVQYSKPNTGFFGGLSLWSSHSKNQSPQPVVQLQQKRVVCRIMVTGTTFNAHIQLLEKVKNTDPELDLVWSPLEENPSDQDYQVLIVFCPIISRPGTDAEAAMSKVSGNKPVILVLMEHAREAKNTNPMRTWDDFSNVVLHAYVFYHETVHGLLQCQQNDQAASKVLMKLLEYSCDTRLPAGRASSSRFSYS